MDIETALWFPGIDVIRRTRPRRPFRLHAESGTPPGGRLHLRAIGQALPFAIELIATRIRLMSPQTLLERMTDSFILSADGMRAVSARQKTLNNAIGWSYDFLSSDEQSLFACLSVFSGGFTLRAAKSVFSHMSPGNQFQT